MELNKQVSNWEKHVLNSTKR